VANTIGTAASGSQSIIVDSLSGIAAGEILTGSGIKAGTFVTSTSGGAGYGSGGYGGGGYGGYLIVNISLPTTAPLSSTPLQFFTVVTLTREDQFAFDSFSPNAATNPGTPLSWAMASEPPLSFDTDSASSIPGNFDLTTLNAAAQFAPPAATLLGIPDDWSHAALYGALADVLASEPEALDRQRAAYCLTRYTESLKQIRDSNWLLDAQIDGVSCDTPSLAEMDDFAPEWQQSASNLPAIVQAGIDFCAPTLGVGQSVSLNLLGNAPLLDSSGTYVQVSRDDFEAALNYSQHLALFKMGGQDFASAVPLLKDFYRAAATYNKRNETYGLYVEELKTEGMRQEKVEVR
jgi:hypothetical protein